MKNACLAAALLLGTAVAAAQPVSAAPSAPAFEAATIKPVEWDPKGGRYITVQGVNRFVARDYTLVMLIAAAYDLSPKAISGGPAWVSTAHFDIAAVTPGDTRPAYDDQMAMLRSLLQDRFSLVFHRQKKQMAAFEIHISRGGSKLKPAAASDSPAKVVSVVYPGRIMMPARNATVSDLARVMQRAILDRPVVDLTGLSSRFDFDLEWAPDGSQFGGEIPAAPEDSPTPPLVVALREQLGLELKSARSPVDTLVIDAADQPTTN